ncbi:heterokaryon incompatibility protein-domain-containing protein [Pyrenochaeta sp. MPI-SDFR-AT-0127]|nr:heterokaryon incompatibility protein-domain-containing protein [Pyrenochaeta sp. MPI-SDFR-AT-0127]
MLCEVCVGLLRDRRNYPLLEGVTQLGVLDSAEEIRGLSGDRETRPEQKPNDPRGNDSISNTHDEEDPGEITTDEDSSDGEATETRGGQVDLGPHSSSLSLIASAHVGCYICRKIWDGLTLPKQRNLRAIESATAHMTALKPVLNENDGQHPSDVLTHASLSTRGREPGKRTLRFWFGKARAPFKDGSEMFILSRLPAARSEPHTYSADCTGSGNSLQTAAWWLKTCLQTHERCNSMTSMPSWYPTRLLYIGEPDTKESHVRLIHTTDEPPTSPYTTLSHRWGGSHFIQLTQSKLKDFHTGIPISNMPRTFQEAIFVSRQQGIRYLWIDSLCIIQDPNDLSDWLREASLMDKVYSHSHCNISASDAENSSEGLFRKHGPQTHVIDKVALCLKGLNQVRQFAECTVIEYYFWQRNIEECPVNRRGWVFQERVLSPRVLHFGHDQLFWECLEHAACEKYLLGMPETSDSYLSPRIKIDIDIHNLRDKGLDLSRHLEKLWVQLVATYSSTTLTNPSDKLIAISGIAKRIASLVNDTYLAGMWRNDLETQLIWQIDNYTNVSEMSTSRPLKYRAPSWSWASVDGPIWLEMGKGRGRHIMVEVEDVVLKYATEDITGLVISGWLDLKGFLKPMKLLWKKDEWCMAIQGNQLVPSTIVNLDVFEQDFPESGDDEPTQRLYYMPIMTITDDPPATKLLLLHQRIDEGSGAFERIGLATCYQTEDNEQDMLLADLKEEKKKALPCLRYENSVHIVRII